MPKITIEIGSYEVTFENGYLEIFKDACCPEENTTVIFDKAETKLLLEFIERRLEEMKNAKNNYGNTDL